MGLSEGSENSMESATDEQSPDTNDKWRWAIYIGLIFLLVANPYTYNLTQRLFGSFMNVAINGCPTTSGVILHCIILIILIRLLMNYKI